MKLKQTTIRKLLDNRAVRLDIAMALGFGEVWTDRLIAANKNNGPLTTIKALQVIREELNLTDSEILEEETVTEDQK